MAGSGIGKRRAAAKTEGGTAYRERRQQIITAAADVFQSKGFGATSLNDVATALRTDRASLYYYVSSKEELFHEVVYAAAAASADRAEEIQRGPGTAREKIRALVMALMESFEEHYPYLFVYIQEDMRQFGSKDDPWAASMQDVNARYEKAAVAIVQQALNDGEIRPVASARVITYGIVGMVNWSHRWYRPTGGLSSEEIGEAYASMVLDGLLFADEKQASRRTRASRE
jgi:TetR/AcrR family transcriptional regulator, cholesterol catabolism regulator